MKRKLLIPLLIILFFPSLVSAAEYYVDYEAGSDSNKGLSIATPFKHAPGDDNAQANAASTTLQPGDTVRFKGGVVYTGRIDIDWSGSENNYITYDGNSGGSWGTGKAEFNLNHLYSQAFYGNGAQSHIRIQNFDIYHAKDVEGDGIIEINRNSHHWEIKDSIIHETEHWEILPPIGSDERPDAYTYGIDIYRSEYITINNVEFYAIGYECIRLYFGDNVLIKNSDFGGRNAGAATGYFMVATSIESSDNIRIFY
jgi:signal peptidase I